MEQILLPIELDVDVVDEDICLDIAEEIHIVGGEHYAGEYIITPKVREQTVLSTTGKIMDGDVTVLEIPYAEVSNIFGGHTATIGGH